MPHKRLSIIAISILVIFIGVSFYLVRLSGWWLGNSPSDYLSNLQSIAEQNWLLFIGFNILIMMTAIVPGSLMAIASGIVFGLMTGFCVAAISVGFGAALAFALGRSFLRPVIRTMLEKYPRLQRFDDAMGLDGWRSVFLLRLSPVMPFALASYSLSLTGISWRDYLIGTLASIPSLFCYVAIGHFAGSSLAALDAGASIWVQGLLIIGIITSAILAIRIGVIAKASLGM
jgi:uncharacterized membrane protein YdjX (TVP38/TMEM64 family)